MPSAFLESVGMSLYPKQIKIVDDFALDGSRVTVKTCNESGKTQKCICGLILWHMMLFPRTGGDGGIVTTSGSWNQIKRQLVPTLKGWKHLFPELEFNNDSILSKSDGIPQWVGFSTKNPGAAEGFHGSVEKPLMALIDECKTVPDENIAMIEDRCNPQRTGLFSSPGYALGAFYDSHGKNRKYYNGHHSITAAECPHIKESDNVRRRAKWGENHPLVKSMLDAEFMEMIEGAPISLTDIERCLEEPPPFSGKLERKVFCDFAAGGDENVLAFRLGNRVTIERAWTEKNTMAAAADFVKMFNRLKQEFGLEPAEVEGDADGLGKPMIDRIHELGWPICYTYNREPRFDSHYFNLASENWYELCHQIKERTIIIPDDLEFKAQLMNRRDQPGDSKGRLRIESKEEMFSATRKGAKVECSPDRAEAIAGAAAKSRSMQPILLGSWRPKPLFDIDNETRIPEDVIAGRWAGS